MLVKKERNKRGYWLDVENLIRELFPICEEIGCFPSQNLLRSIGRGDIIRPIQIHGGSRSISVAMGYDIAKNSIITSDGHIVRSKYEVIVDNFFSINNIKHTTEELIVKKSNRNFKYDFKVLSLSGEYLFIEVWGYENGESKREKEYYKKRIEKEKFYEKNNKKLLSIEKRQLAQPFDKIYMSLVAFCIENNIKKKGFKELNKSMNLFISHAYSYEDLLDELKPYIKKFGGFMPTSTFLRSEAYGGLVDRIMKFGGFKSVKKRLSIETKPKQKKWCKKNSLFQLKKLCNKYNRMPTHKEICDSGMSSLSNSIKSMGGIHMVSEIMCFDRKDDSKKHGFWNIEKNVLSELLPIYTKLRRMPTHKELRSMNENSLSKAIIIMGGTSYFDKKMKNYR